MFSNFQTKRTLIALAITGALGASTTHAQEPYAKPDDSWVSISGTVVEPTADDFVLDYGDGDILVEMDDWDAYGDAYGLLDGDKVTVNGRIDDDFYEVAKIEAGSVYVESLDTYFYASSVDDESVAYDPVYWTVTTPVVVSTMTLRGDVTSTDAGDKTFTIDHLGSEIQVDVDGLEYNPLDDKGFQQIEKGDYVSVTGMADADFMDGEAFQADLVTTLLDESEMEDES